MICSVYYISLSASSINGNWPWTIKQTAKGFVSILTEPMVSHSDPLHFFHSLPPASNVDVRKIKGNFPDPQKQLAANVLAYFISTGKTWGAGVGQRLNLVEINISGLEGGTQEVQTILEIDVTEGKLYNHLIDSR